ncbi:MAG: chemotaxis protein CheD [Desulfobulbaceae bacterium]|nr:chemotaxis protein CheD [Desulfobulbaceae bacterium]HIJ78094.1 chemotaxis protein CheD [Deltaproteobacteria bacterium]
MMPMPEKELPTVILGPGELFVARKPTIITTILGSCVAVCLYCPQHRIGAMCHGVLPRFGKQFENDSFRFVVSSIRHMVEVMANGKKHCPNSGLVAKVFGGAEVLGFSRKSSKKGSIGVQNIEAARNSLKDLSVSIKVEEVGGVNGRKLFFYSHSGEVYMKPIPRSIK